MTQSAVKLLLCDGRSFVNICSHVTKPLLLRPLPVAETQKRCWHEKTRYTVWVPDKPNKNERSTKENIERGFKIIRKGIPQWQQEWRDRLESDFRIVAQHGDYEYLAKFNSIETIKDWVVSVDGDFNMGKSKASFTLSPSSKTGLFHGYLNTQPPKDGKSRLGGYCNIRCPRKYKSFQRPVPYDWSRYTHLYLKVRGDGRNYMLNLNMDRYFDLHWHDMYQFPLYTRGGPYWQITKVPLKKFYHTHAARIQDVQEEALRQLEFIKYFSIGIMDNVAGRFQLEIDSIALVRDESDDLEAEYEMYDKRFM